MARVTRRTLSEARATRGRTNWARLLSLTDDQISRACVSDRTAPGLSEAQLRLFRPPGVGDRGPRSAKG